MFGPLFRYELTRLARRGLQPRLRGAFAGLLLLALLLAYLSAFPGVSPFHLLTEIDEPLSIEAASRFGASFATAFLLVQTLAVVLVTPVLAAGAIGDEKDRRSLDLLLTTPLTDREIVGGKLAARLVFIGMLLFTGLPVAVLTVFFGGVDPERLLAGSAIALCTVCSLGAFSLWLAVTLPTLGGALWRAYGVALGLSLFGAMCACFRLPALLSPLGALMVLIDGWPGFMSPSSPVDPFAVVAMYAVVHLGLAFVFVLLAARRLREPATPAAPVAPPALPLVPRDDDLPPVETPQSPAAPARTVMIPEVDDADPLGWKERYFGGAVRPTRDLLLGLLAIGFLPSVLAFILLLPPPEGAEELALGGILFAGLGGILAAGYRAARCVARERQQGTLDGLLMLPGERRAIVFAKARAAAWLACWLVPLGAVALLFGMLRGDIAWPALLGVPVVFAGWLVGAVGFGLWLSVRYATRERAVAWFLGLGLTVSVVMPLVGRVFSAPPSGPFEMVLAFALSGLSPPVGLWNATITPWEWDAAARLAFDGAVAAAIVVGVMGVAFGAMAVRRFEKRE